MFGFFPVFWLEGKEAPNIKNLRGQGSLGGGGSKKGVWGKILYVYAFSGAAFSEQLSASLGPIKKGTFTFGK